MFSTDPVLSTLLALAITLALIWLGARLVMIITPAGGAAGISGRRISSSSAMLTIESSTPIGPRRRVIVLRYGEHRFAVLTGGPQDIALGPLPSPASSPLP
jgi:flagellar biogenesis protein FliO